MFRRRGATPKPPWPKSTPTRLASRTEGYRYDELRSTYGGIEQRWILLSSESRQPQAQRTVDTAVAPAERQEVKALKH